jgi:hypothetical protein
MNFISLISRKIEPTGLNKENIFNFNTIKNHIYHDDYQKITSLKLNCQLTSKDSFHLYYPGCGADIIYPLLYITHLIPNSKEIKLTFVDKSNHLDLIKTILDDIKINFKQATPTSISFYTNNILFNLQFITKDITYFNLDNFDIYFEKSFRIFKERIFEKKVYEDLNENGIIISDNGFENLNLKRFNIPKEISIYDDMIIAIKPPIDHNNQ